MMKRLNYARDKEVKSILKNRRFEVSEEIKSVVTEIIAEVKEKGDQALFHYTSKFDGADLNDLKVSQTEIDKAVQTVDQNFLQSLNNAIQNIKEFHEKQLRDNWFSNQGQSMVGQLINPLQRIGAYVPGGRAAYPSSVLMTVVPAQVAGVEEIVVVTPPGEDGQLNPYTLAALKETGVDEVYKIGGAQAIAGLAWGTDTIKPVDKIVGPGNIYVTCAKKMVYGQVDIDMLAGPSEVLILADDTARADYIAADLLSQAEHDPMAVPMLVTTSKKVAEKTEAEVEKQLQELPDADIAREAWENNGLIIEVKDIEIGMELVNKLAPEHFELVVEEPFSYLGLVKNAGAVFVGEYSSEPLGDYMAGPNHVLPTGGTAKFASPLNTDDFLKKSSLIYYQKEGLREVEKDVREIAELEGLDAHAAAIKKRFKEK